MAQQRLVAVDQLQHHEIPHLRAAHLAGGADALGQGVAPVRQHGDHFLEAGQQVVAGMEVQEAGEERRVQGDHPIGRGIEHLAHLELHEQLVVVLLGQLQTEVRLAAADLAEAVVAGVRVGHVPVQGDETRQHVLLLGPAAFDVIAGGQRQGQIDRRAGGVRRDVQHQRRLLGAEVEQRAVGQDAAGPAQHQLAHVEELPVDFQTEEAPRIVAQALGAALQLMVVIAVALLEVLWLEQHAFLPDHLVQGHVSRSPARGYPGAARPGRRDAGAPCAAPAPRAE